MISLRNPANPLPQARELRRVNAYRVPSRWISVVVSLLWDAVVSLTHGDNTNTHDSTAALVGARPLTQGLAAAGKELWRTLHSHMDSLLRMAVLVPDLPRKKSSVRVQPDMAATPQGGPRKSVRLSRHVCGTQWEPDHCELSQDLVLATLILTESKRTNARAEAAPRGRIQEAITTTPLRHHA